MKTTAQTLSLISVFILLTVWTTLAQEKRTLRTDSLREKIEQLERTDISVKPPSARVIYQRSLLRLYNQFSESVQQDISSLKYIQSTVIDVNSAQQKIIIDDIQKLLAERREITEKIQQLKSELLADASTSFVNATTTAKSKTAIETPTENITSVRSIPSFDQLIIADRKNAQALAHPQAPSDDCYPNAPPLLVGAVDVAARQISIDGDADALASQFPKIFIYAVLNGVSSEITKLDTYRYMGETARTDKQIGASARAEGSTSAVEKPGFADLLAFAIEHGAIQKEVNGTTLTLSTSPYALVAASRGDTAQTYDDYEFFNRIGISASFNIDNTDNVLLNARRKQLQEWSVRVRLTGDRSTRSKDFADFWNQSVKPAIEQTLLARSSTESLFDQDATLRNLSKSVEDGITTEINANLTKNPITATTTQAERDQRASEIRKIILCRVGNFIYTPINNPTSEAKVEISPSIRARVPLIIQSFKDAQDAIAKARESLENYLDVLETKPMSTLAYTNERTEIGSDISVFKFLYEQKTFSPMKIVANAGVSVYHNPDPLLNQQNIRDFAVALSLEGKVRSPFVTNELDLSNITYAFTGRYQRILENRNIPGRKADIGVAQFKLEIPFLAGMSLPFSVTYANATEMERKDHFRVNFGVNLDTVKLFALRKLSNLAISK